MSGEIPSSEEAAMARAMQIAAMCGGEFAVSPPDVPPLPVSTTQYTKDGAEYVNGMTLYEACRGDPTGDYGPNEHHIHERKDTQQYTTPRRTYVGVPLGLGHTDLGDASRYYSYRPNAVREILEWLTEDQNKIAEQFLEWQSQLPLPDRGEEE